jgi:hypothetical protein
VFLTNKRVWRWQCRHPSNSPPFHTFAFGWVGFAVLIQSAMPDPEELGRRRNAVGVSDAPTALETSSNNLIQVMRAVEDTEATIRQQVASLFFLVYDGLDYLTLPHVLFMFSAGGERPVEGRTHAQDAGATNSCKRSLFQILPSRQ